MKRLFFSLSVVLLLGISSTATAACAYLNTSSGGFRLLPGQSDDVYGPTTVSCAGMFSFEFKDLSSNKPTNIIIHRFQRRVGTSWFSSWETVSSTYSYNALTVKLYFFPRGPGQYRYTIENVGQSTVSSWSVTGKVPLFTIPGT